MITKLRFLSLAVLCGLSQIHAQNITGTITGIVHDPTGAVVPHATVKVVNIGTSASFTAIADSSGEYVLRTIPIGEYRIEVEAPGFKKYAAGGIRLQVDEIARLNVTLVVGSIGESITVSTEVVNVDTTTATLKDVVDQRRIEDLPLNGRNPTQLMQLMAGVTEDTKNSGDLTSGTTYPGVTPVSVNGARGNTTNYILDGANNNDHYTNAPNPMPNPDALQEFSVQTNNFSAEFGRQSGGVVNAVTKSGTNEFHGAAFEYVRNLDLNATNFFAPVVNGAKLTDGLKRNQFGATFGGPVELPKLYNGHDKTFFFVSYQGTRIIQAPTTSSIVVPTAAQRAGLFTKTLKDPTNGGNYPNNQIPASQISPITQQIMQYIPLPTSGTTIFTAAPNNRNDDQGLARGDQQIGNNDRLSVRYFRSVGNTPGWLNPTDVLENQNALYWLNTSFSVTETRIFAPTLTNQALFSFNRTNGINTPVYPPKTFHDLGINVFSDQYPEWKVGVSSYFTIGTGDTNQFLRDEYQLTDTLRWTRGRHEMSFGGEYARGYGRVINDYRADGTFNFNGGSAPFTGESFADFLVGKFYDFQQGAGEYRNTYFNRIGLFAQDAWRVRPNFTVTLGVRWEPFFPYTEANGKLAVWQPGQQSQRFINAPTGVVFPGDAGVPDGGYPIAWRNLAPRLGFAWNVFGDGKTAIRGGYGIFYDQPDTLYMNSQVDQAPFGTLVDTFGTTGNSLRDPYAGTVNPFPASNNPPKDAYFPQYSSQFLFAPQMRNPYVQSWNLTAERELKAGFILRASYAGSKGTRLIAIRELNQAVYAPGVTTSTTNQRRPYGPGIGSLAYVEPVGNSSFNAFQFTVERRFAKGFSILANYQFAKSLDDASINKGNAIDRVNTNNQRFDKGRSDFDRAHVFHFSSLWELPVHLQNRALNAIAGGWNVNSIVVLESGLPFSVSSGVDNARTGTSGQRGDLIGNPYLADGRSRGAQILAWLNTAAFTTNALNTFGNLGRNIFNGPGLATTDLGLAKNFRISERVRSTLRFEAFNAFNRVNLNVNGLDRTVTDSKFMQSTSAFDPRILQIALRLSF